MLPIHQLMAFASMTISPQAAAVHNCWRIPPRPCLLLVDDEVTNIDLLSDIFEEAFEVIVATEGLAALELALERKPDLILLDVMMPGMNGYEVCRRLKADSRTSNSSVIFITGLGNVADETRGLELGAVDYVTKPFNPAAVRARVNNQIKLRNAQAQLVAMAAAEHSCKMAAEIERSEEMDRMRRRELQQKDDFISHVSHELRSPLASIYSFSTIIADGLAGETTPQQNEYLQIVRGPTQGHDRGFAPRDAGQVRRDQRRVTALSGLRSHRLRSPDACGRRQV
jgi:DNA-binding response OmpR family regulator